jgi:hypothetical protein
MGKKKMKKAVLAGVDLLPEERAIHVEVKGVAPGLLMNSAKSMLLQVRAKKRAEIPGPEEDAESRAYRMKDETLCIPSAAFYGTLVNSSAAYRIQKKSAAGLIAGTVRIWPDEISLGTKKYEIDLRPVVVQRNRIVRARPLLKEWAAEFKIVYDSTYGITADLLKKIFTEAGKRIGILDFRPQHRGQFGRFVISQWKEL